MLIDLDFSPSQEVWLDRGNIVKGIINKIMINKDCTIQYHVKIDKIGTIIVAKNKIFKTKFEAENNKKY